MVLDYNSCKGGTDAFDQMVGRFSVKQRSKRWPMSVFYWIVDSATLNSYRLFSIDDTVKRKEYLSDLAVSLMKPLQQRRSINNHWYSKTVANILELSANLHDKLSGEKPAESSSVLPQSSRKRARCASCPRNRDLKTSIQCYICNNSVCNDHRVILCLKCFDQ